MVRPSVPRRPALVVLGVVAVGATGQARGIEAQTPSGSIPADSAELRDRARDSQRRFERIRVRHLPRTWDWPSGPCEIRIGRFCQWHDPDGDWTPPPEDPEIGEAREELLSVLAEAGVRHPGDGWVLGQRVQYLAEAGRWDEARRLAEGCPAATLGWWCPALLGFVLHGSGSFVAAERAFERALGPATTASAAGLPGHDEEIAEWHRPTELLDGKGRDLLEEAGGEGRAALLRRFWTLADPLHLVPGNDRRTEHLARRVLARIRRDTWSPFGGRVRGDLQEILVRYGWEVGWERSRTRPGSLSDREPVLGQQHPRAQRFVPPGSLLADPFSAEAGSWIDDGRAPPATYAPAYAPDLVELEAQVAVFRLGDSIRVVGAYRLPPEEEGPLREREGKEGTFLFASPAGHPGAVSEGGLFLVPWDPAEAARVFGTRREGSAEGALAVRAPAGSYVVSLEHLDREARRAGRYRLGVREEAHPAGVPVISDLLLLEGGTALPETLEEAIPVARPGTRLARGEPVRVAFAIHGLREEEEVTLRLTLQPADPGLLRRAGEWLGLLDPERPVALDWGEVADVGPGLYFRAVEVELPAVDPGLYALRLAAGLRGRTTMISSRVVEVVR